MTPTTLLAYTDIGTVVAGWGITCGSIAAYAVLVIRRGRRLSEIVPPEDRRWS